MASGQFRFDRFLLDLDNRRLLDDGRPVELNNRYFDALALLVQEHGKLVGKDRFLDEVWRGVPVTDEALTQGIKAIRRQLGDDAARPRFIETVPKHGYRFVAAVDDPAPASTTPEPAYFGLRNMVLLGGAGTVGGGLAGFAGGLIYGFAGASQPLQPETGAASAVLVIWSLSILVALVGGAGVAFGIAAATHIRPGFFAVIGGAIGGLLVGGISKLLGLDAFNLLLGRSPGDITGAGEGLMLGGAVGLGFWLVSRREGALRFRLWPATLCGALAGILIPLLGGKLMAGSLHELARNMPGSRLRLGDLGRLLGEQDFGLLSQTVTGGLEGALFASGIVAAMILADRQLRLVRPSQPGRQMPKSST
jgi:DNA-binding winged helix-turn-helix (wHTH) protein